MSKEAKPTYYLVAITVLLVISLFSFTSVYSAPTETNQTSFWKTIYCNTIGDWFNSPRCPLEEDIDIMEYNTVTLVDDEPNTQINNTDTNKTESNPPSINKITINRDSPTTISPTNTKTPIFDLSILNNYVTKDYLSSHTSNTNSGDYVTRDFLSRQVGAIGDSFGRSLSDLSTRLTALIPSTASITNWDSFFTTPSTRILAGTNLSWDGNTLNAVGIAGESLTLSSNIFGQSSLTSTTTQNLAISGTGTSTFSGGLESWRQISSPYFHATSTTATSTFAGGLSVTGNVRAQNYVATSTTATSTFAGAITVGANTHASTINTSNIAMWGDSMTVGIAPIMAYSSGYPIYEGGVGGESSTAIKNRMVAAASVHGYNTIIWAGRNNFSATTTVLADIASMVASLGHNRYLVLAVLNGSTEPSGTTEYNNIIAINTALANAYGSHYIDIRSQLVALYNPALPQDVIDHGNDVVPTSLRYDTQHPNYTGYLDISNMIVPQILTLTDQITAPVLSQNNISDLFTARNLWAFKKAIIGVPPDGGTPSNPLTVTGDAYFVNNLGIGTAAPGSNLDVGGNFRVATTGVVTFVNVTGGSSKIYQDKTVSAGGINIFNQTVDIFKGNGGTLIANGVPSLPRGVQIDPLATGYPAMLVSGFSGYGNIIHPATTLHIVGTSTDSNVGGNTAYYGGGKQHYYPIYGDAYGSGSAYTLGVPNTTNNTYKGGRSGAYIKGGDGYNYAGGGAGVVAIGGSTAQGLGTAEGGAGVYAKGGLNGDGTTYAWAGYFDGSLGVNGKLGIGTTSPYARLSVHAGATDTYNATLFSIASSTSSYATTTLLVVLANGNVGIGTTSPFTKLSVAGNAYIGGNLTATGTVTFNNLTASTGAGSICLSATKELVYNAGSDACLPSLRSTKHDINNLSTSSLSTLNLLTPVSFIYNQGDNRTRYGFIAEDVSQIDTHLATYNDKGEISGIDDRALIALAIGSIKELDIKIRNIITSVGEWVFSKITATLGVFDRIESDSVKSNSVETKGIQMTDKVTGQVYCISLSGGNLDKSIGPCSTATTTTIISPTSSPEPSPTVTSDSTPTPAPSTTPLPGSLTPSPDPTITPIPEPSPILEPTPTPSITPISDLPTPTPDATPVSEPTSSETTE